MESSVDSESDDPMAENRKRVKLLQDIQENILQKADLI